MATATEKLNIAVANMTKLHNAAKETSAQIAAEAEAHAEKARLETVPTSEHAGAKF